MWLGEAAAGLVQAADYDIPAARRQAARAQTQLGDLERRAAECARSAAAAARAYQQVGGRCAARPGAVLRVHQQTGPNASTAASCAVLGRCKS